MRLLLKHLTKAVPPHATYIMGWKEREMHTSCLDIHSLSYAPGTCALQPSCVNIKFLTSRDYQQK